jgi:hypothetical protein
MHHADAIVTATIGDDWGALSTRALVERFPGKVLTHTPIYYAGVHPDITYLGSTGRRLRSPLGDYHSRIVIASYLDGLDEERCAARFDGEGFEAMGYEALATTSADEYLARDRDVDVKFATTLLERLAARPQLLTLNHPNASAISALAARTCGALGQPMHAHCAALQPSVLDSDVIWPVHGFWADRLRLPYRTADVFWRGHYLIPLEEFVWRSYRGYAAVGDAALRGALEARAAGSPTPGVSHGDDRKAATTA